MATVSMTHSVSVDSKFTPPAWFSLHNSSPLVDVPTNVSSISYRHLTFSKAQTEPKALPSSPKPALSSGPPNSEF